MNNAVKLPVLSERMASIEDFAGKCRCIADIGTDHGLIPIYMVLSGIAERAVLTDIAKGPLQRAMDNVEKYAGGEDGKRFSLRLGPGLDTLEEDEADVIIIAGMGGETIIDILEADPDIAKAAGRLVLQPRTMCAELRKWLTSNGYSITDERLAEENGHIAQIMHVVPGEHEYAERFKNEIDYDVPPQLFLNRDPLLDEYIALLKRRAETVLANLENAKEKDAELAEYWEKRLTELKNL